MPHLLLGRSEERHVTLFETLAEALRAEWNYEATEHRRLLALEFPDRVAAGISWPMVQVDSCELRPRGGTLVQVRAPRGVVLHRGLEAGQPVTLRSGGSSWAALVLGRDDRVAELRIREDVEVAGEVEITARLEDRALARSLEALSRGAEQDSALCRALLGEVMAGEPMPHPLFSSLDGSQAGAAAAARGAPALALIHGPPGTGKTHTIAALVQALVSDGERPLALADSNAATDHLALALHGRGLRVLRLGVLARMSGEVRSLGLEQALATGPYGKALARMHRELRRLRQAGHYREMRSLRREIREVEQSAEDHAVQGADVLCCTLGSLPRFASGVGVRRTAVVDEATQAMEPTIWSVVPWVQRLVLVGDPEQLGPVVKQPANPLEVSLFERLLAEGWPAHRLETQYRMHAQIQGLVQGVYGPAYRPHESVAAHRLCDLSSVQSHPGTSTPVLFVDTAGTGCHDVRDPVTCSQHNPGEVALVTRVVQDWLASGVAAEDIGVMAPYSAQVARLAQLGVEVDTVNAFQGREKEAVVCCFVRSNEDGELGFVADPRRLTVAITRARRAWVGIGDSATLMGSPAMAAMLSAVEESGALTSAWEEPWAECLGLS